MRRKLSALAVALAVGVVGLATVPAGQAGADVTNTGGDYVALSTTGVLADTRSGLGVPKAAIGATASVSVPVLGHAGVPSSGVSAVLVVITALAPTVNTWLSTYPDGTTNPGTANLNALANTVSVSNTAVVQVGSDGKIALYNRAGSVNVVVDVQGYYTTSTAPGGPGGYLPVPYTRILDTRTGVGAAKAQVAAGASITLTVTGGPVPSTASSVYLDLIIANATKSGWISMYPYGGTSSADAVLSFPGYLTSHGVTAKPGSGKVVLVNHSSAPVDLVATQEGYTTDTSTTGAGFHPTRQRVQSNLSVPANGTITVPIAGRPGLPIQHVTGAVLNLAGSSTVGGYLKAWGTGNPEPNTSSVDFPANDARDGMSVVGLTDAGSITIRNNTSAATTVWMDLLGWFSDEHRSAAPASFTPTVALQLPGVGTAAGALEYSYVDNVGRLVVGYQASPDDFSSTGVSWTTVSSIADQLTGEPDLNVRPDGSALLSAEYADTSVRTTTQAAGSTSWSGFTNVGGSFSAPPATAAMASGTLESFAIDDAGALWTRTDSASAYWTAVSSTPALVGTPTVVSSSNGVQVFAVTRDGQVETASLPDGGALSSWTNLGGVGVTDRPAVAVRPGNLYQVVVRQGDGSIATKPESAGGSYPTNWAPVAGFTAVGAPATVFDPVTGQIEILARGQDNHIYNSGETVQGSQVWRSWQEVDQGLTSATDPTIATFTGSANGDGWVAPFRDPSNATKVIVRTYNGGISAAAAHPTFATRTLRLPTR